MFFEITNQTDKISNRNRVLCYLQKNGPITKQELSDALRLSLPTVTNFLMQLMTDGLVVERGSVGNTGGRNAKLYDLNAKSVYVIGADINSAHVSVVILNMKGEKIFSNHVYKRFEKTGEYALSVRDIIMTAVRDSGIAENSILKVALAVQGLVNPGGDTVTYGKIQNITGLTIDKIAKFIPYPVVFCHDCDMAAFAEYWSNPEKPRAVYISLSTNLGGAITDSMIIGEINNAGPARIEHMTLVPDGRKCYCGRYGCADAYCSTSILTDETEDGRLSTFFSRLHAGDRHCNTIWNRYTDYISIILNNAKLLYDADVIIGGYLAEHLSEKELLQIKEKTYCRYSFGDCDDYLRVAAVKEEPIATGAALYILDEYCRSI